MEAWHPGSYTLSLSSRVPRLKAFGLVGDSPFFSPTSGEPPETL